MTMMRSTPDTVTTIVDVAERLICFGGYDAFTRDEVDALAGVQPATMSHHFPDEADLAAAVARRYAEAAIAALGNPDDRATTAADRLGRLIRLFREALREDRRMCLCGMLSADAAALPAAVAAEVRRFFDRIVDWTARVIGHEAQGGRAADPRMRALRVLATLQGAVMVARSEGDPALFDGLTVDVVREALRVQTKSIGGASADRAWSRRSVGGCRIDEGLSAVY